jgi:hypothetical protein
MLIDHHLSGRISDEEFDSRSAQVNRARTVGELWDVFADLPVSGTPLGYSPERADYRRGPWCGIPAPVLALTAAALAGAGIAFTVTTHFPPFFLFPLFWLVLLRGLWWNRPRWAPMGGASYPWGECRPWPLTKARDTADLRGGAGTSPGRSAGPDTVRRERQPARAGRRLPPAPSGKQQPASSTRQWPTGVSMSAKARSA